jgi:hypothetical protein
MSLKRSDVSVGVVQLRLRGATCLVRLAYPPPQYPRRNRRHDPGS